MASHDDDKAIDFKKLENKLNSAVEADAKYWRENDAKFRAIHQKVATYEEFRDIVLASHLKPLEKEDRLTDIKFVQPWNSHLNKQDNPANKPTRTEIPQGDDAFPKSGQTFIREWRKFNKDTSNQYQYLVTIGAERLGNIFKPEIGFGLLGEFAKCLNCEIQKEHCGDIKDILNNLSKTNRFSLTVQFLSSKEKEDLHELFGKLRDFWEDNLGHSDADGNAVSLDELEKVYEIKK